MPALINTLIAVVLALIVAAPIGIFSAIYLAEYAKKNQQGGRSHQTYIGDFVGVPSIVYGLFGLLFL